jgi:uncharacterized integral membrane protein
MRLQSLVVAFLAVVAGAFVLLNLDIVVEMRSVQLPGGHLTVPIIGITLLVAVGALIGMLLLSVVEDFSRRRTQRRLYARLAQSEHELALVKSAAYDRVAPLLEATHREISMWIEGETRRQEHLRTQLAELQRAVQARLVAEADREGGVSRVATEREAA